ncbi:substrate-binding domain-containing protein [Streptomyces cinereospinus]|uniref:Substrate-binding domain-containing protein n=1 Tax=Streptomyces cinereospinus TaxID=285561 RepID=A0ABV5NA28_9ACTN
MFAAGDLQAFGASTALRERGLRIPEDIGVAGFDDVPVTRWSDPALTTVRQPLQEMAAMAAAALLRLVDGEDVNLPRGSSPPSWWSAAARRRPWRSRAPVERGITGPG